jgi:hypothetical protein
VEAANTIIEDGGKGAPGAAIHKGSGLKRSINEARLKAINSINNYVEEQMSQQSPGSIIKRHDLIAWQVKYIEDTWYKDGWNKPSSELYEWGPTPWVYVVDKANGLSVVELSHGEWGIVKTDGDLINYSFDPTLMEDYSHSHGWFIGTTFTSLTDALNTANHYARELNADKLGVPWEEQQKGSAARLNDSKKEVRAAAAGNNWPAPQADRGGR